MHEQYAQYAQGAIHAHVLFNFLRCAQHISGRSSIIVYHHHHHPQCIDDDDGHHHKCRPYFVIIDDDDDHKCRAYISQVILNSTSLSGPKPLCAADPVFAIE